MDLETILTGTQAVAVHAGTGVLTGAAAGYAYNRIHEELTGDYERSDKGLVIGAITGLAAAIAGPEVMVPAASEYLHQPSLWGVALGTVGVATVAAVAGTVSGFLLGAATDFDDHGGVLAAGQFMVYGAAGATALYLASQVANYCR